MIYNIQVFLSIYFLQKNQETSCTLFHHRITSPSHSPYIRLHGIHGYQPQIHSLGEFYEAPVTIQMLIKTHKSRLASSCLRAVEKNGFFFERA